MANIAKNGKKESEDVEMNNFIYADNAATTKLDIDAFEAMKPYLLTEYGNVSQPYSFSRSGKKALKNARETIAKCINANPEEIYFTSGGTESDNWAIKGTARNNVNKNAIITSAFEHHAVLNSCKAIEDLGYPVAYINPNKNGIVDVKSLEEIITSDTELVSIMYANNEIGTIQPIKDLCEISHKYNALFHTDSVQAIGHVPIDVKMLGIDMLSASAHKFNGPKGIGFLYIKNGTDIGTYSDGGSQELGMRAGTENIASIVGMSVALDKNYKEMTSNISHIKNVEKHLLERLTNSGIRFVRNGQSDMLPGIISLSFENHDGEAILHRLDLMGICISTGAACDTRKTEISHVLKSINIPESYARGTIRISLGKNNTVDDANLIAEALIKIIK